VTDAGDRDALDRLEPETRAQLEAFAEAVDRIHVDDLPLHARRVREPRHRRAVETAELVAIESGLSEPVEAARRAMVEAVIRTFGVRQFRVWIGGENMAPNMGPVDERVRIAASLADAVTAIVLGDRLEPDVRHELLGLWDRLLP
jgi:hypothetical protein